MERYWAGETSPQEERALRQFFAKHPVLPPDAKKYRPWFSGIDGVSQGLDGDFDSRMLAAIDRKKEGRRVSLWRYRIAAASFLLLLFAGVKLTTSQAGKEQSLAYIDGKKYTNMHRIGAETLQSLNSLDESGNGIISSQIEALEIILDNDK
jgi:hypothetical protein